MCVLPMCDDREHTHRYNGYYKYINNRKTAAKPLENVRGRRFFDNATFTHA